MSQDDGNASLESLGFLAGFFQQETFNVQHVWTAFGRVLTESNAEVRFRDDSWEQDWFLAKYAAEAPAVGITGHYQPPRDFFAFPRFDVDDCVARLTAASGLTAARSRSRLPVASLFDGRAPGSIKMPTALAEFDDLRQRIAVHGDPPMIQLNHALAWLDLALGRLFKGIALTPLDGNFEQLLQVCQQRWDLVWREKDIYEGHMNVPEVIQWKLDVFYGAELREVGLGMQPSRQGQPEHWREHFDWLSTPADPQIALAGVRMAARLMASIPIYLFFQELFRQADQAVTTGHLLAVTIFRRWTLELQVMSWLERALQRRWKHLRTEDLATFAFSALRPHWPRRLLGISHRSMDVKGALRATRAWDNFRYCIDATFVPHWETNVATVWGLFSTTPGLIRVPSPHYQDSVWCLREQELFEYLRDEDDFLDGRYLLELPPSQVHRLDLLVPAEDHPQGPSSLQTPGRFPRPTTVFTLYPYEAWENRLLACVAAVRMIALRLVDPELVRMACLRLASGARPPPGFEPLTNHPGGWSSVMELFADFQRQWGDGADDFPLTVDREEYARAEVERDLRCLDTIQDLRDGTRAERDVLAAWEWHRTVLPTLVADHRYGAFFAIDYRRLTEESWARGDELMVIRGTNGIRTSVPLWFLQGEGQRVDEWKGMGMRPVFTQHASEQWSWMWELLQEPEWPANFHRSCKLRFSNKLAAACAATSTRGRDYYRGKVAGT